MKFVQMKTKKLRILLVVADQRELPPHLFKSLKPIFPNHEIEILYTGLGRQSADVLSRKLDSSPAYDYVLNVGTTAAVNSSLNLGDVVVPFKCLKVERIPDYIDTVNSSILLRNVLPHTLKVILLTSDEFVTKEDLPNLLKKVGRFDIIDMECYNYIQVCRDYNVNLS